MRKLSAKWVPKCLNAVQKRQRCQPSEQFLEFFRRDPNDFLSRFVTMDETRLYHYGPETKQQSMECRHSGLPSPKKFRVQKFAGKVLASIFWDQDGILLIVYLLKCQTIKAEYYSSLLVKLKGILKEKRRRNFTKGVLFLYDKTPGRRALATRRYWPSWASSVLITHPILRIYFHRTTTCSLDWKNNWKVAIFRPTRRSLLPRRRSWTDKFLNFFEWLTNVRAKAKKYIELRVEYVEKIPSLVAVACFLPGRAKDLLASPRTGCFMCWFI